MAYLVDTDILIEISRGNEKAIKLFNELDDIKISVISAMELIVGARNKKEIVAIEEFLFLYERVHINEEISVKALELIEHYSLSDGLSIPDAFIAATAINKNLILTTKNIKHFRAIEDVELNEPNY